MGSETDSLRVNAARADITPSTLLPLFGRARRSGAARTIASRLEANVLLFDAPDGPAAIIAIDSLYASQQLEDEVRRQTAARGLSFSQGALLFVASHTHNAPSLDPTKPRLGPFDVGYLDFAAARITEALLVARWPRAASTTGWHALRMGRPFAPHPRFAAAPLWGSTLRGCGCRSGWSWHPMCASRSTSG
ncbi:MAG: hypothetical protein RI979_936 [Pseudomonadota bacterium]